MSRVTSSVDLASDAGRVTLEASLGSADLARLTNAPIDGRIKGLVRNVPLIAGLTPDLSDLRGETTLDLRVAGTLLQPEIYGDYNIKDGAAAVPRLGITVHDVQFALRGDGRTLEFEGEAQSGSGKIAFTGTLAPGAEGWQGNASISGQDSPGRSPEARAHLAGRARNAERTQSARRGRRRRSAREHRATGLRGRRARFARRCHRRPEAAAQERSQWQLDAQLRLNTRRRRGITASGR